MNGQQSIPFTENNKYWSINFNQLVSLNFDSLVTRNYESLVLVIETIEYLELLRWFRKY